MARLHQSESPETYVDIRTFVWSQTEKVIARKAFEHALQKELHEVIQKAKQMAATIEQSTASTTTVIRFFQRSSEASSGKAASTR
jgi:hypothetical protein